MYSRAVLSAPTMPAKVTEKAGRGSKQASALATLAAEPPATLGCGGVCVAA